MFEKLKNSKRGGSRHVGAVAAHSAIFDYETWVDQQRSPYTYKQAVVLLRDTVGNSQEFIKEKTGDNYGHQKNYCDLWTRETRPIVNRQLDKIAGRPTYHQSRWEDPSNP